MADDVLTFDAVAVPDIDDAITADIPADEAPSVPEIACVECGKELTYSGRGRKPKYCDEHKPKNSAANPARSKRGDAIAREAADVLVQINGLIQVGMLIVPEPYKMPRTAMKLDAVSDKFGEQAFEALKASPALAKAIARAGGVSGSAGLIIAYGMLAASIAPVAVEEWKSKRGKD